MPIFLYRFIVLYRLTVVHRLAEYEEGCFYIERPAEFRANGYLSFEDTEECFDFAYDMTFGREGQHRSRRSGGQSDRRNGEIFIDTFQGKLAEYAFYNVFKNSDADIEPPDTRTMGLSEWDTCDFTVNGYEIAIKSTKFFGNLLLLETKDWVEDGRYIPNYSNGCCEYDYFVLERIRPEGTTMMKENRWLYSDDLDYGILKDAILSQDWEANLVGYISREEFVTEVIDKCQILPQNSMLNGRTRMDAENYYVQAGDLHPMNEFIRMVFS